MSDPLVVILPASNEAGYIGPCLTALLAQEAAGEVWVILAANACRDDTVARAMGFAPQFAARGWRLILDDSPLPGKLAALNRAEALAPAEAPRVYLDADVICDPALLGQIRAALDRPEPAYATGRLQIAPAHSWVTRAYGRFWSLLPFVTEGAVGAGVFALNAKGRARFGAFPQIISDDSYVRLHFSPSERHEVPAPYHWPLVEGLGALIRVRRRQDAGVAQIARDYPGLLRNGSDTKPDLWALARAQPLGFAVYALVKLAVRLGPQPKDWSRGR